ncbi:MAG: hypothetical protein JXA13_11565 [Anaerolineales bacterium]|nr:hypothetical protein [Anaerolineales bacterium]
MSTPALAGGAREKLSTTMVYARANDKNVAEDYFSAMEQVEKRLNTAPEGQKQEKNKQIVNVQGQNDLLELTEQLAQLVLSGEERLALVGQLRDAY